MKKRKKAYLMMFVATFMILNLFFIGKDIRANAAGKTTAYLTFSDSAWGDAQYWNNGNEKGVKATNVDVDDYGQYTVALDFSELPDGKAADIAFLDVEIVGGEIRYPNCFMKIDSVNINGEEVELGTYYTDSEDGITSRTILYQEGKTIVKTGRTLDGEIDDTASAPINGKEFHDIKQIEVTFTLEKGIAFDATGMESLNHVNGTEDVSEENTEVISEGNVTDEKEGYTAFLMFADGSNAWENYDQGIGTECKVVGDGIYEVSLNARQCGATGQAAPMKEGCVLLIDILNFASELERTGVLTADDNDKFTVSDIKVSVAVIVDGTQIETKDENIVCGDIGSKGTFRIDMVHAFDEMGTKENPVVNLKELTPKNKIKVVFSLEGTGMNSGADTNLSSYLKKNEPFAEGDTEEILGEKREWSDSQVMYLVLVIIILVILARGVYVLKRKKR